MFVGSGRTQLWDIALGISSGQTFEKRIRTGLLHLTTFASLGSSASRLVLKINYLIFFIIIDLIIS